MKKRMLIIAMCSALLTGCGYSGGNTESDTKVPEKTEIATEFATELAAEIETELKTELGTEVSAEIETENKTEPESMKLSIYPLPDPTMDNLTDAILPVSIEEGGVYADDAGNMQMNVKIYSYDMYDMVDISMMKEGDTFVTNAGEIEVSSLERGENGMIYVNGGLENGGFDLATEDNGIFFETGYNDAKNWYEVGEATISVSAEFKGYDSADPDQEEIVFDTDSFLNGEVINYNFTPYNTTIRVEGGQIVEMNRRYIP